MKLFLMLTVLILNVAQAASLQMGTYSGVDANKNSFDLHVQEVPGRIDSFMGILMNAQQARIYLIDKFSNGKYGMLSLRPLDNYVIGALQTVPTFALTVTDQTVVVTPNHTSSDLAFTGSISFKNSIKKLNWLDLASNNYDDGRMVVSALDSNNEATVTSKTTDYPGDFVLRESRPNLFVMLESQLNPTGVKLGKNVKNLVFFQKTGLMQKGRMIIVNGETGAYKAFSK